MKIVLFFNVESNKSDWDQTLKLGLAKNFIKEVFGKVVKYNHFHKMDYDTKFEIKLNIEQVSDIQYRLYEIFNNKPYFGNKKVWIHGGSVSLNFESKNTLIDLFFHPYDGKIKWVQNY